MSRPKLLNIKEVAEMLGISPKTVYNNWHEWVVKYGISIHRLNATGHPRFYESDILRMIEACRAA